MHEENVEIASNVSAVKMMGDLQDLLKRVKALQDSDSPVGDTEREELARDLAKVAENAHPFLPEAVMDSAVKELLESVSRAQKAVKIRATNDRLRKLLPAVEHPHKVTLSEQVGALEPEALARLMLLVRDFDDFSEDNNPHGEHDLGQVEMGGESYFWKYDYYDDAFEGHQEDGNRVLILMETSEY